MNNLPLSAALSQATACSMPIAHALFDAIRAATTDGVGISREPYSELEQRACDLLQTQATAMSLETCIDAFGNLSMTLPGRGRDQAGWITGSHIDSVPTGGNFDGLAGVIAGLTAVAALRSAGIVPAADVTVMGLRGEEASAWYGGAHGGHIGSRAALGLLPAAELDSAINSRTGRSLRAHMLDAGYRPDQVVEGRAVMDLDRYRGWLELHIEQGPVLERLGLPVGIVTGIRGAVRARDCRCLGAYTHSGAVPHEYRSDAVLATVELIHELEAEAERLRSAGHDLTFTVGKLFTDAALHSITKVPGDVGFCLEFRSQEDDVLACMTERARTASARIAQARRVEFDLGHFSPQKPATMDAGFRASLARGASDLDIATMDIPSGAGHDAQDFVHAGLPAAMIFVRNANGSHNAREAMDAADFELGTRLLAWMMAH
ncbi:MAG: Zn-dependent hydrolase [Proteobacteria bacterium]|nr:Zn-dependent hydrolase [Burkholderiales bacterium]